jgi:putative ABC transport system substrate-binding protein
MTSWPFAATAERPQRVRRIGVLMTYSDVGEVWAFRNIILDAFRHKLQELEWIAGRNLEIDIRWATVETYPVNAAELVSLSPDVLVGTNTPTTKALRDATQTIPIVFVTISDPVSTGLVSNLSRPGGNLTGFTDYEYSMGGKWVELLKELRPKLPTSHFSLAPTLRRSRRATFSRRKVQLQLCR